MRIGKESQGILFFVPGSVWERVGKRHDDKGRFLGNEGNLQDWAGTETERERRNCVRKGRSRWRGGISKRNL